MPVGKNLDTDFATGVLVVAVRNCIDKGFAERTPRVFFAS